MNQQRWQQLLKQLRFVVKEVKRLRRENALLKERLTHAQEQIQTLMAERDALQMRHSALSQEEKEQLKKQIEMYLCELDTCITLLQERFENG